MSDILTRLLLNTGDYDSKLAKAKKSSNDFASNIGTKAVAAVGKFAAGIGVAMGGVEAFKKMMDSTQTSGDLMRGTIEGLKNSVNEFFYSVNKGNLSLFIQNLSTIAAKGKEAYAALDQLGNTQISYGVLSSKNSAAIAEAQYLAKNKFAPTDVRKTAFDNWKNAIISEEGNVKALQRELVNAATKAVSARTNANLKITIEDLIKAFEVDLKDKNSRELAKSRAEMGMRNYEANAKRKDWTQEEKDALAELQRENIITYTMLEKYSEEELQQIAKQIQQYYALINAVKGLGREYNETANEFNNANKSVKGFSPISSLKDYTVYSGGNESGKNFTAPTEKAVEAVKGSIAYIDAEIKRLQTEYANTASDAARTAAAKAIDELQRQKGVIELHARVTMPGVGNGKSGSLADLASMPDFSKIDLNLKPQIEANTEYKDSVLEVVNAVGTLTGSFSQGASTAVSYFANVVNGVLQASAAIAALIPLKKAEATANAEVAVTGAAASAASTPIVGWLMAGAAVASVIAAMTNIPKFADGGIIGGSSYVGDKLLARVNSGEMILNQKQQSRLLSMTDGGNVRVSGDVKLSGKDIFISLRNYMASSGNKL